MTYAQIKAGNKLHLVFEPGEGRDKANLIEAGKLSIPLCGITKFEKYRMSINLPLGNACKNCQRVYSRLNQ